MVSNSIGRFVKGFSFPYFASIFPLFYFIIRLLYLGRCLSVFLWAIEINSMAYHIFHRILLFLFSERHLWTILSVVRPPFQTLLQFVVAIYSFAFLGFCNQYSILEKILTNILLLQKNSWEFCTYAKCYKRPMARKCLLSLLLRSLEYCAHSRNADSNAFPFSHKRPWYFLLRFCSFPLRVIHYTILFGRQGHFVSDVLFLSSQCRICANVD